MKNRPGGPLFQATHSTDQEGGLVHDNHPVSPEAFDHLPVHARAFEFILQHVRILRIAISNDQGHGQGIGTAKGLSKQMAGIPINVADMKQMGQFGKIVVDLTC